MGIWEWVGSTAESIKQNAPSIPTPVKNGVGVSYNYGCAAFTKIDQTVRVNGLNRLGQRLPDDETRAKLSLYATKFAKNAGLYALQEGYKLLPGGNAFSKILSNTLNDVKLENLRDEKIKRLEEKSYTPKKHSSGDRKTIEGAEIHGGGAIASASNDGLYAKSIPDMSPEDVIRVFMMKEFIGNRFLDDLMVPTKTTRGKKAE